MATKTNVSLLLFLSLFLGIFCRHGPRHRHIPHGRDFRAQFKQFHNHFRRPYRHGTQEYRHRFEAFKSNLELIDKFNSLRKHNDSARYGITKFSDLTQEEFKVKYLSGLHKVPKHLLYATQKPSSSSSKKLLVNQISKTNSIFKQTGASNTSSSLPLKVDLREKNVLAPVRNQKACGGCWAFSVVEAVETMAAMQTMTVVPLSVQEVIDCSIRFENSLWGCKGGDTCHALKWLNQTQKPLVPETNYPLKDESEQCHLPNDTKTGVKITQYTCEDLRTDEEQIQRYLATVGPVSVSVDATTWSNYMGGIIQFHCGEMPNNHAVVIIGYDKTGDIPYYIVKNSWGTDFGDNGYMYIAMGRNVCGIAQEVSTVTVNV